MNKSIILHIVGWILSVEAAFMLLPLICAVIYQEKSGFAFLITMGIGLLIGLPLVIYKPKSKLFFAKEGLVSVGLGWIAMSSLGALPFTISGEIPNYVDALFEIISGFTTTGSSILKDIEALSYCMLFWRSFTHWIGGMGILVFVLAILPMSGGERMHIMRAESPGPSIEKLVPRMRTTAKILYSIYLGMTLLQIILFLIGGMPLFDALTITFGTAGTGGLAIKNDSMLSYSPYLQTVTTVFMFLFGVNFNIYYLILFRKIKTALRSEELRAYVLIVLTAIILISFNLGGFKGFFSSIHHAAFQVSSIITTTGYASVDFNTWPTFSKSILVFIMFIGACAGSTGGGLKVSRIVMLFKALMKELSFLIHKRSVKVLKFDGNKIEHETLRSVNVFFACYMFIFAISVILVSLDNYDFTSSFTAVAATLNNIGPGLEVVGPLGNFSDFSYFSKFVMMFDMLVGRLEIFPILILFSPATWKK
ncbi:TrkH family potassium uptake protein [Lachnospiraceae bacterium MD1]|uniref:TrkH family potassium uptake protein n=1 Tax=Variimorphobacter saccharofermentans TaxID=2755051 RepID=A0A839JXZ0_9FIRM|nr:TrkH family potassium uptake protein [Variimorphobacter saccharofermentans]MBB2181489.1 TrkH family potassium uptake protein [Variimorphobacter saccharofermentans]